MSLFKITPISISLYENGYENAFEIVAQFLAINNIIM